MLECKGLALIYFILIMNGKLIGGILVVVVVIAGSWYLFSGKTASAPVTNSQVTLPEVTTAAATTTSPTTTAITITYSDSGFSPKSISIAVGTSVTFVNKSSERMWVASDPHPSHTAYDGTSRSQHCVAGYTGPIPLDECAAAAADGSYSFTFTKVGTWGYHNHAHDELSGTVVVTAQ